MNEQRRRVIRRALACVNYALPLVEEALDEETEARDATPEGLDQSARYEESVEAVGFLDEAKEKLEGAAEALEEIVGE